MPSNLIIKTIIIFEVRGHVDLGFDANGKKNM